MTRDGELLGSPIRRKILQRDNPTTINVHFVFNQFVLLQFSYMLKLSLVVARFSIDRKSKIMFVCLMVLKRHFQQYFSYIVAGKIM